MSINMDKYAEIRNDQNKGRLADKQAFHKTLSKNIVMVQQFNGKEKNE